jgi:membrane-associated HD superfamily phosphohydrolase
MGFRPRFKTPFSQARDKLLAYAIRPFMVFQPRTRFLIGCAVLVTLTTLLLITDYSSGFNETYKEGEVLARDIVAPADITTVDQSETNRKKDAAREAANPVFNYDSTRAETSVQSFRAGWEDLKQQIAPNKNIAEDALDRLASIVRDISSGYIYDDNDLSRLQQNIVLVDQRNRATQVIVPAPLTRMVSLSAARQDLELRTEVCFDRCAAAAHPSKRRPRSNRKCDCTRDRSKSSQAHRDHVEAKSSRGA